MLVCEAQCTSLGFSAEWSANWMLLQSTHHSNARSEDCHACIKELGSDYRLTQQASRPDCNAIIRLHRLHIPALIQL